MLKETVKAQNPIAYKMIVQAFLNNKVAHAFLFSAPANYEIDEEWQLLAQFLLTQNLETTLSRALSSYPDVVIIDGTEELIKKDQVNQALNTLSQTSLEKNAIKILVIRKVENSNKQSINALLKFIEEPPQQTFVILTTNQEGKVLPTIKSRCQVIKLKIPRYQDLAFALAPTYPQNYKLLAGIITDLKQAKATNELIEKYQKDLLKFLKAALTNKDSFFPNFYALLTKNNALILLQILQVFFNDLWKVATKQKIIWNEALARDYHRQNFNFAKALKAINEFFVAQNYYVNFDLAKTKALITLGDCYE